MEKENDIENNKIMKNKMKLIIFSDIHYLNKRPEVIDYNYSRKLTQYCIPLMTNLIDKINNEFKPDAVINLGDLIEDTLDEKQDLENLQYIWNYLKKINVPFYSAIGNHDIRSMSNLDGIHKIMEYKKTSFSVDSNGYHLIILNTEIRNNLGTETGGIYKTQYVSENDIKWLKNDLENNNLPAIIFTHFGLAEDDMKENYWFYIDSELALLKNRKEIKEIIKNDANIVCVFSGHQHWTKINTEDGIKYYQIGSLTENIANDNIKQYHRGPFKEKIDIKEKPDGVFFEVNLLGKEMEIVEHHIEIENN